jgi:hypothetical protein
LFPDEKTSRNYKTKEKEVTERVTEEFPDLSWITDKRVEDGCSRRRPDLLLDMGSHLLIIEIDEHKHEGYDCSCENKRLMEISLDLQHRPIVFVRFNPDSYVKYRRKKNKFVLETQLIWSVVYTQKQKGRMGKKNTNFN